MPEQTTSTGKMLSAQGVVDLMLRVRLVAIVRLPDLSQAVRLSRALVEGGVVALEFTLTNRDALNAIGEVQAALPEYAAGSVVIGAGSVNSADDARASIDAGAQFIVAPTTKMPVIEVCKDANVPVMPGAYTPTEIENAWEAGADVVKVFPASTLGPPYIKAVRAPLPHLKLMPTGGVDLDNMGDFFNAGAVAVGVGGNLLDKQAIADGDWAAITATARRYADAARG